MLPSSNPAKNEKKNLKIYVANFHKCFECLKISIMAKKKQRSKMLFKIAFVGHFFCHDFDECHFHDKFLQAHKNICKVFTKENIQIFFIFYYVFYFAVH